MKKLSKEECAEIAGNLGLSVDENCQIKEIGCRIDHTDKTVVAFSPFFSYESISPYLLKSEDEKFLIVLRPGEQDNKILEDNSEEKSEEEHKELIEIRDIQDRDENVRRDTLGHIFHYPTEGKNHIIKIERDMKNHFVDGNLISFHLNLILDKDGEESVEDLCSTCWDYFEPIDHMEICFKKGRKDGYKFPDWEATYKKIREILYSSDLKLESKTGTQ